jgi:3-oxoacyl-(acyl-carrier-protein) synthase
MRAAQRATGTSGTSTRRHGHPGQRPHRDCRHPPGVRRACGQTGDQFQKIDAGHALGAAAALECLATAIALRDGVLPPTANFNGPDPECDLDVIPNVARIQQVEYALSNSFAFGGLNAVLVLRTA